MLYTGFTRISEEVYYRPTNLKELFPLNSREKYKSCQYDIAHFINRLGKASTFMWHSNLNYSKFETETLGYARFGYTQPSGKASHP